MPKKILVGMFVGIYDNSVWDLNNAVNDNGKSRISHYGVGAIVIEYKKKVEPGGSCVK